MVKKMTSSSSYRILKIVAGAIVAASCLAVTTSGLSAASKTPASSGPAFVGPIRYEGTLAGAHALEVSARAQAMRDTLDFPVGSERVARHVRDGFQQIEYDEVEELDADGRILAVAQFDSSGRLRAAVRFDAHARPSRPMGRDAATKAAQRAATAAGLPATGALRTESDPASEGWTVHWAREVEGVPVRGDETRVHVWPDGRVQSLSRAEHRLAARPARPLDRTQAAAIADQYLDGWFAQSSSGYSLQGMNLEWAAPNGAFNANAPDDPQAACRLAWVVNVKPTGAASDYLRLITMYIDAGDGSLLGGDFVE